MTDGLLIEVLTRPLGSSTTAACPAGATTIPIEDPTDFDGKTGGQVSIADVVYDYVGLDEDASDLVLAAPGLTADVPAHEPVSVLVSGELGVTYWAIVDTTEPGDGGEDTWVPLLTREARLAWPVKVYDPPVPVKLAPDNSAIIGGGDIQPRMDPRHLQTGSLGADTAIYAGDPNGKRVVMDGTGIPAFEAYDATNHQTVNIDGGDNYIEGTLATAADGSRVEVGPGPSFDGEAEEVRFYSGSADEVVPASLIAGVDTTGPNDIGLLDLRGHEWDGAGGATPRLRLTSGGPTWVSELEIAADETHMNSDRVVVEGVLDATMDAGSVGTGTFRNSVDARVTAVGNAAYQPLDADLTTLAAVTPGATGLALLDDATAAEARTTLQAAPLRPSVLAVSGTAHTLAAVDERKIHQFSNSAAVTVTLPSDTTATISSAYEVEVVQIGAGVVSFVADAGVTINSKNSLLAVSARYGSVRVRKRAANTWILTGDLA